VLDSTSSGGVVVNDTILHVANVNLPFGGVGNSGMGAYHGQKGFDTFSHLKSVLKRSSRIWTRMLYAPYKKGALKLVKKFLG
jgi:aldehyde dehydrogenase (NAD+)